MALYPPFIMTKSKYIHVVSSIDANSSGIAYYVINHIKYMDKYFENKLFCINNIFPNYQSKSNKLIGLFSFVNSLGKHNNVIHFHGFWSIRILTILIFCRLLGMKYVISPHGSLEHEALQISPNKKNFLLNLFLKNLIRNSLYLVAYSEKERFSLSSFIDTSKIIQTAIGIDQIPDDFKIDGEFIKNNSILDGRKIILCITRIHKAKGLDILLKAWASLPQFYTGWRIIIAGPDDGYLSELLKIRSQLNLEDSVSILKKMKNTEKFTLYKMANIFILPSLSENFGIVIAEALICKLPVITTIFTPWVYMSKETGCYCISPDSISIENALCEVINANPFNLTERKILGYKYIKENHSWDKLTFEYHQKVMRFIG